MQLLEAMNKAKEINSQKGSVNATVSRSVYGGYSVFTEPVELTIIKNSITMLVATNKSFSANVKAKYGR